MVEIRKESIQNQISWSKIFMAKKAGTETQR